MLHSWVPGADGSGFSAEHLPYGVFAPASGEPVEPGEPGEPFRVGVRIGEHILDLAALAQAGLVAGEPDDYATDSLNPFMAAGPDRWRQVREQLIDLTCDPAARDRVEAALWPAHAATLALPFRVADYVDFYSSLEHATNLGRLFRPGGEPLLPNWRHLPVGYHGRAGTVVVSGTPVPRPWGQRRHREDTLVCGPSSRLDLELELGVVIGQPSRPGTSVTVAEAPDHVFGVVLVNDWSARDIQAWEYQPLGPFLGKSFATSVAAWVTPLDALADARVPGPLQEPEPLDYLRRDEPWGLALDLSVHLRPAPEAAASGDTHAPEPPERPPPQQLSTAPFGGMYWQFPQQIAHMTVNGASLRTGDLLASGTVSGPERGTEGSLVELTWGGAEPLVVAGQERAFLEDGDEVILRGEAVVDDGVVLTLGEVRGEVVASAAEEVAMDVRRHAFG